MLTLSRKITFASIAIAGMLAGPAVANADCAVTVSTLFALGSDPAKSTMVYGFNVSRNDGKAIDARVDALAADGTRLREFEVQGAIPTAQKKFNEWSGLAFSITGGSLSSVEITAESEPGIDQLRPCSAPAVGVQSDIAPARGAFSAGRGAIGALELSGPLVPASNAVAAVDVHFTRVTTMTALAYPSSAVSAGRQGQTVVDVTVAVDGSVSDAVVLTSSGVRALDDAALAAARSSIYSLATMNGVPVASHFSATYEFRINSNRR
jgi:TonB family protein